MALSLSKMLAFMADKYGERRDASGRSKVLHPLAVMAKMDTDTERIVALAHDLVEDFEDVTLDTLKGLGFTEGMLYSIDCITRREDKTEGYEEYINRVKQDSLARKVKIADLEINFDIRTLKNRRVLEQKDLDRLNKYLTAWSSLMGI